MVLNVGKTLTNIENQISQLEKSKEFKENPIGSSDKINEINKSIKDVVGEIIPSSLEPKVMIKITDLTNRVAKLSGNIVNQIESSRRKIEDMVKRIQA